MGSIPPSGQPPRDFPQPDVPAPTGGTPPKTKSGKVKHVSIVAILMIIQGSLDGMMGLMFLIAGPVFLARGSSMRSCTGAPMSYGETTLQGAISIIFGIVALIAGIFLLIGGIKNLKYRSRTLGIVALSVGALAIITCYCAPTSIALLIYGLIIYLNDDVKAAFASGEQGLSPAQIKAQF